MKDEKILNTVIGKVDVDELEKLSLAGGEGDAEPAAFTTPLCIIAITSIVVESANFATNYFSCKKKC